MTMFTKFMYITTVKDDMHGGISVCDFFTVPFSHLMPSNLAL